jgi:uncharacterized protein (TIGR02588 family)
MARRAARKPAQEQKPKPQPQPRVQERIEWLLAAMSGLVLAGLCGFLVYEAITARDGVAFIVLEAGRGFANPDGSHALPVIARNRGAAAAADIEIEGTPVGGGETASGRTRIDYLPAGGHREATLVFPADPGAVQLRVLGYSAP